MLKLNKSRRTLCVVSYDYNSTYEELLASHNDIFIYQKHLKHLAIEVYKSLMNLNPELLQFKEVFLLKKSIKNWTVYKRSTVLVLHVEDFKIFVYYVRSSVC